MAAEKPDKAFADFVKSAPSAADLTSGRTTTVTGTVYRAEEADKFVLATADGQTAELPIDAVVRHKVIDASGLNAVSQLEVVIAKIAGRLTLKELIKEPLKELIKDVIKDPARKELPKDIIKEPIKEPIFDPGTLWNDPPGGTLQENIDIGDPGQVVVNPAAQAGAAAGGMTPFIMATPHHAPQAAVMQQQLAGPVAAAAGLGGLTARTIKEVITDHFADQPWTRKELIKDPILDTRKEMIWDTYKEAAYDTWVEQGFDPGQGLGNPPHWNLPGMMW